MTPKEVDDIDPELRNAFWNMMRYEDEQKESEAFKQQSKAFHAKQK